MIYVVNHCQTSTFAQQKKYAMKYLIFLVLPLLVIACDQAKKTKPVAAPAETGAGLDPFDLASYTFENVPGSDIQMAVKKSEEGVIREMGNALNGKRVGTWTLYGKDPVRPRKIVNYVDGKKNGVYIEMNEAGSIDIIAHFKDNKLHGSWAKYRFGRPLETAEYQNGELHGPQREFQIRDGKIIREANYKNGKLDGPFKHFNDKGEVTLQYEYKDGVKTGEGVLHPKDSIR